MDLLFHGFRYGVMERKSRGMVEGVWGVVDFRGMVAGWEKSGVLNILYRNDTFIFLLKVLDPIIHNNQI